MSQALAWQTTSRSFGFVNSERSQNVFGQRVEAERGEEPFAVPDHLQGVRVPGLQDLGQVVARIRVLRSDQRIDVLPVLRPHVAQQMRRDRPLLRDGVAVLLAQLPPDVRVERDVERPHLLPEAIELGGEGVGRHVVLRPPHRARVLEPELTRALVGQLDEAHVVLLHRAADGVPAGPDVEKLSRIARGRHDLRDVFEIEAAVLRRAVLALAVGAFHRGADPRQLRALGGIRGSGHRQRELEELELARRLLGHRDLVEAHRVLRVLDARLDRLVGGLRREDLGIVGDVRGLDPVGAALSGPELQQRLLGSVDERLGVGRGGRAGGSLCGHLSGAR